jgi:polysaccharide export outer membrane protein
MLIAFLTLCVLLFTPFAHAVSPLHGTVQQAAYKLGPGDVIAVDVYTQPDLSAEEILVRPDGMAAFRGVGDLPVTGKTPTEVSELLAESLKTLVLDPHVVITLTKTRPSIVYLAGAVQHPGMYQITTDVAHSFEQGKPGVNRLDFRLSNILANAGGISLDADIGRIQIVRGDSGDTETVNLWQMLKQGDSSHDPLLSSGDRVVVPSAPAMSVSDEDFALLLRSAISPKNFPVRVMGQVTTPGTISLPSESPYLNTAIGKAEGILLGSNKHEAVIRRLTHQGNFTEWRINPNQQEVMLRPNDVVFLREMKVYTAGRTMEQVSKILLPVTSLAWPMVFILR